MKNQITQAQHVCGVASALYDMILIWKILSF